MKGQISFGWEGGTSDDTSHIIKRRRSRTEAILSEMDIYGGRAERFVAEKSLYGHEVNTVLIEMSTESMAERMACNAVRPAEASLVIINMTANIESIHRALFLSDLREEPVHRPAAFTPVQSKDLKSILREDGVSVGAVLGMRNVYAHVFSGDILIFQMTDFTDS